MDIGQQTKGLTLAHGMLSDLDGPRTAGSLAKLDVATSWQELAGLAQPLHRNHSTKSGRPNLPVVVMLKVTLMQRRLGLSDRQMEAANHATSAIFRKRLHDERLVGELFDAVNSQLAPHPPGKCAPCQRHRQRDV